MIKFFRHIRQQMIATNKISRYLLYAFGEIVLVVIGILIALQINNWNDQRKYDENMQSYLKNIQKDLKTDLDISQENLKLIRDYVNLHKAFLTLSDYSTFHSDSLKKLLDIRYFRFPTNRTTFEKISNSGITQISKDELFSDKIYDYYNTLYQRAELMNSWDENSSRSKANFIFSNETNFEIDAGYYQYEATKNIPMVLDSLTNRKRMLDILTKIHIRNELKIDLYRKSRIQQYFENREDKIQELISEIDQVLVTY